MAIGHSPHIGVLQQSDPNDPLNQVDMLRQQVLRIKAERKLSFDRQQAILEAERLRKEIRNMGEEPCA